MSMLQCEEGKVDGAWRQARGERLDNSVVVMGAMNCIVTGGVCEK